MTGLGDRILAWLEKEGPQTTRELADGLEAGLGQIFDECRELEDADRVISELLKFRAFFFPPTGEALGRANHERIGRMAAELRAILKRHRVPGDRDALRAELRAHFSDLYQRPALAPHREAMESFEEELMQAVRQAKTRSSLMRLIGPLPVGRGGRLWALPEDEASMREQL